MYTWWAGLCLCPDMLHVSQPFFLPHKANPHTLHVALGCTCWILCHLSLFYTLTSFLPWRSKSLILHATLSYPP
jgi:hypothetical protein